MLQSVRDLPSDQRCRVLSLVAALGLEVGDDVRCVVKAIHVLLVKE